MCPSHVFILVLAVTISLSYFNSMSDATLVPCKRCMSQAECDADPGDCIWGEARNFCGKRICSKGPGEKCGGHFNIQGICGEGMWCARIEGRCQGCYIPTMTCYPTPEND